MQINLNDVTVGQLRPFMSMVPGGDVVLQAALGEFKSQLLLEQVNVLSEQVQKHAEKELADESPDVTPEAPEAPEPGLPSDAPTEGDKGAKERTTK